MRGARIARVELRRPDLRRPFPADFARRLTGQTVESVTRRGKDLLAHLDSGDTLLVHLGMSGSFRARPRNGHDAEADSHDHVVLELSSGVVVTFNDPRRFGLMDLVGAQEAAAHETLRALGPEPLGEAFDAAVLASVCAGKRMSLKVALLDSAARCRRGEHLCERGPASRAPVAAPPGIHHCHWRQRPARHGHQARGGYQGCAESGRRTSGTSLWSRPVSRLRQGRATVSAPRVSRHNPPHHPGRTLDLFLPVVPTLSGANRQQAAPISVVS